MLRLYDKPDGLLTQMVAGRCCTEHDQCHVIVLFGAGGEGVGGSRAMIIARAATICGFKDADSTTRII
jgi:hypothetical protein